LSSQSIVLLIMGVSGSGKSFIGKELAKRLSFDFIDADHYHTAMNKAKMHNGIPLTNKDRLPWLNKLSKFVGEWAATGSNGILACSALKEDYRIILLANAKHKHILYLKGSYELIAERLALRQHEFMNSNLLLSQFKTLQEPKEAIYLDVSKTPEQILEFACSKLEEIENTECKLKL
jgi:gluconokinase